MGVKEAMEEEPFRGKIHLKVDRSAAYAARHLAKNLVASGLCDEVLVQVAYAIGVADPVSLFINTYGTSTIALTDGEIAEKVQQLISLRPYDIEQRFKLRDRSTLKQQLMDIWDDLPKS